MLLVTIHMEKCGNAIKKTNKQKSLPGLDRTHTKSASLLRKNQF